MSVNVNLDSDYDDIKKNNTKLLNSFNIADDKNINNFEDDAVSRVDNVEKRHGFSMSGKWLLIVNGFLFSIAVIAFLVTLCLFVPTVAQNAFFQNHLNRSLQRHQDCVNAQSIMQQNMTETLHNWQQCVDDIMHHKNILAKMNFDMESLRASNINKELRIQELTDKVAALTTRLNLENDHRLAPANTHNNNVSPWYLKMFSGASLPKPSYYLLLLSLPLAFSIIFNH